MCITDSRFHSIDVHYSSFESFFGNREWTFIRAASDLDEQRKRFYLHWCLKEAYVKAIGVGIVMDLSRVQFDMANINNITLFLDGSVDLRWQFELQPLNATHWVGVAMELQRPKEKDAVWYCLNPEDLLPVTAAYTFDKIIG